MTSMTHSWPYNVSKIRGNISHGNAHQLVQMSACQCCSVFVFDEIHFRGARFTHISTPEHRQDSDSEILKIRAAWHILPNYSRVTIFSIHQRNVLLKRDYLRCDFTNVSVTEHSLSLFWQSWGDLGSRRDSSHLTTPRWNVHWSYPVAFPRTRCVYDPPHMFLLLPLPFHDVYSK